MLDEDSGSAASTGTTTSGTAEAPKRRRAVSRPAGPPAATTFSAAEPPAEPKRTTKKKSTKKATPTAEADGGADESNAASVKPVDAPEADATVGDAADDTAKKATAKKATSRKRQSKKPADDADDSDMSVGATEVSRATTASPFAAPLFQAPDPVRARSKPAPEPTEEPAAASDHADDDSDDGSDDSGGTRRRRRRGGRRRRRSDDEAPEAGDQDDDSSKAKSSGEQTKKTDDSDDSDHGGSSDDKSDDGSSRRRRRRRRRGEEPAAATDDPANTVTKVRERRSAEDEITSVSGSTRLEAKKQRRREGREAGRRRAPIVTEAEFLARRESVKREMVIRQRPDLSQIAVLEDDVLVEHYVAAASQSSMIGNVYLGRVQNVLPSMEAAFIDIGKGRNGVLYAGEVDWKALGNGKPRKIEEVLKSGQTVLVQVTKDPIGHKGARLTSQVSLAGRFLVYVPGGQTNGISRKLPDTERNRLKGLLKEILPEEAGVIIRTAAEGATEEQLQRDVSALTARWDDIEQKAEKQNGPQLLYGEPDLMIKVVRDLFNEDFAKLTVEGDEAWDMVNGYVQHVAPDLSDRLEHWTSGDKDSFESYRIDEQISKAVDRKVWLPSGGSLIIDRTEAMTVIDVNTGKFTGSGGNLEETVTKNNLEAAEEIVRQLRLRDIGGIIVIDFIDMVLENNRDLVLRRLVECLGRDRTRHQVAEVTSLGLVQMTRKRIGTGLVEAFSETCEHCNGRGLIIHNEPVEPRKRSDDSPRGRRRGKGRGGEKSDGEKSDGEKSGGDKSGGEKSGGEKSGGEKSGGDNADRRGNDERKPASKTGKGGNDKPKAESTSGEQPKGGDEPKAGEQPTSGADKPKSGGRRSRSRKGSSNGESKSEETPTSGDVSTSGDATPTGDSVAAGVAEAPTAH
ncbi:Rne/Rng family ribonuclease [Solicola gregarius]|uniref:Ribonuclease E n=1 Tax=Solicola gregarius TaxID=2908642 RepID=A0AA46YJ98_9ACTN|nr:Rne/Rng family ribonuclease [Solicola gregarius]UYM04320.1 Rne/Rng family ribonuclease [Solicola gregarius]